MTASEVIHQFRQAGGKFSVDSEGHLNTWDPSATISDELYAALGEHRDEIIELLRLEARKKRDALAELERLEARAGRLWQTRDLAEDLADELELAGDEGRSRSQLIRAYRNRCRTDDLQAALDLLRRAGRARVETVKGAGRPAEVWFLAPADDPDFDETIDLGETEDPDFPETIDLGETEDDFLDFLVEDWIHSSPRADGDAREGHSPAVGPVDLTPPSPRVDGVAIDREHLDEVQADRTTEVRKEESN